VRICVLRATDKDASKKPIRVSGWRRSGKWCKP
jgi:hypothetical protein